jgi:hypothetical protein
MALAQVGAGQAIHLTQCRIWADSRQFSGMSDSVRWTRKDYEEIEV